MLKSANCCPLAARNSSLMNNFNPNYFLPVFFYEYKSNTSLHGLQSSVLFSSFFSWSKCHASVHSDQKRPQSSVTVCRQEGKGWIDEQIDGWIDRW